MLRFESSELRAQGAEKKAKSKKQSREPKSRMWRFES
jgi:hypothetical protein